MWIFVHLYFCFPKMLAFNFLGGFSFLQLFKRLETNNAFCFWYPSLAVKQIKNLRPYRHFLEILELNVSILTPFINMSKI
jgi:hypothetical protein